MAAREMAQLVKCLPLKHESPSLTPSNHWKSLVLQYMLGITRLKRQRGAPWACWLPTEPNQQVPCSVRSCLKNKVESNWCQPLASCMCRYMCVKHIHTKNYCLILEKLIHSKKRNYYMVQWVKVGINLIPRIHMV